MPGKPQYRRRRTKLRRPSYRKARRTTFRRKKTGLSARLSRWKIRQKAVIPDKTFVKLKYSQGFTYLDATGTSEGIQVFRGNSIYDPDLTGTGHQPYGHDQWETMYTNYLVLGSKIEVKTYPYYTTAAQSLANSTIMCIVKPSVLSTPEDTQLYDIPERPFTKHGVIQANASKPLILKHYCPTGKQYGLTSKEIKNNEGNWGAVFGVDPTYQWYWHVYHCAMDNTTTWSAQFYVTLTYYCRLRYRKVFATS